MRKRPFAGRVAAWAERMLDRSTFECVVVPALADLEHECAAAGGSRWTQRLVCWRASWGLLKAIAVCCVLGTLRDVRGTGPVVVGRMLRILPSLVLFLTLPTSPWLYGFAMQYGVAAGLAATALSLPANVLMAIPVCFFLALAFHRELTQRLVSTTVAGGLVFGAVVFVLLMDVVPRVNTEYRTFVISTIQTTHPSANLRPGLSEMTGRMLSEQIANPPSVRQGALARAHRQERFAFVALIPVLGLLGLAFAGLWQSRALTLLAAIGVFTLYGVWLSVAPALMARRSPVPAAPWAANVVLLGLAMWMLRVRRSRAALS